MNHQPSSALETDLYHVDAAYIAWSSELHGSATFDLYARSAPFGGAFMLMAGLEPALDFIRAFRYSSSDLDFLRSLGRYSDSFLQELASLCFTGNVLANEEGDIVFPNEPLLRVTAPLIEALLIESGLLRAVGVGTLIATKAARMALVAQGAILADFSLRRAHDPYTSARSSYIGGFHSTSFVDASRRFGIPATGTIPHALVQAFPDESTAFSAVASTFSTYSLLLDTYDLSGGIHHAIQVGLDSQANGNHSLAAVRLDSGDLDAGSRLIRSELDAAGLTDVKVLVSGDIDEFRIQQLMQSGVPIDGFGVGGNLGAGLGTTESGHVGGVLGAVYKLSSYESGRTSPRMKIAGDKSTLPGKKRSFRIGNFQRDLVQLDHEPSPRDARELLIPVVVDGEPVYTSPSLNQIRKRSIESLALLPPQYSALTSEVDYPVCLSEELRDLATTTRSRIETANQ